MDGDLVSKVNIRPPSNIIGRRLSSFIKGPDDVTPDPEYQLIEGHYYVCRDDDSRIVVLRATSERVGTRPLFVMAPGETAAVGSCELLIIADLGPEAP